MKTMLLLTTLTLLLSSCKKDDINASQFYGTWEIRSAISTMAPSIFYQAGNGHYIELKPDGTINRYENGNLLSSETFKISKKTIAECKLTTNEYLAIEYGSGRYDQIRHNKDTLTIATPPCMYDGGHTTYVRIKR